jgi:hypothetical protein
MSELYIIDQNQIDVALSAFNPEDIEFLRRYKENRGFFPTYRDLQQDNRYVKEIYPEHTKSNIKLKTFVEFYLKNFNTLKSLLSNKERLTLKKFTGKGPAEKQLLSKDFKQVFRSELEVVAYNIFVVHNLTDQIIVEDTSFLKTCNKIPDFYWPNKKIVIEIAGRKEFDYLKKLQDAQVCFKKMGLTPIIIYTRSYEKSSKYKEFYIDFCNLVGLKPKPEIIENPYKFLGKQSLNLQYMLNYIEQNVGKYDKNSNTTRLLNKYLQQLYGISLRDYQKQLNLPRYKERGSKKDEIIKYKQENPHLSNKQIADKFNLSKSQIQRILTSI